MADGDKAAPAQPQLDLGAAPAAAPAAAPPPVVAQVAEAAPAPQPEPVAAPAPAAEPVKAAEAAPAPVVAADDLNAPPSERPTLLEKAAEAAAAKDAAKPDAKPAEVADKAAKPDDKTAKPAEAAKAAEKPGEKAAAAAKPAEAAAAPTPIDFTKFKMPDALKDTTADNPRMVEFTGALQEALANPQDAGQKLLDMHATAMTEYANQTLKNQIKAFNETRNSWAKDVMGDAQIGGAGHDTAMGAIARMRDMLVSTANPGTKEYAADHKALDTFLRVTGAGDHPVFLRMLHNAARYFDEPGLPPDNPQPPPDNGRQNGARKRILYDHPRSTANRAQ